MKAVKYFWRHKYGNPRLHKFYFFSGFLKIFFPYQGPIFLLLDWKPFTNCCIRAALYQQERRWLKNKGLGTWMRNCKKRGWGVMLRCCLHQHLVKNRCHLDQHMWQGHGRCSAMQQVVVIEGERWIPWWIVRWGTIHGPCWRQSTRKKSEAFSKNCSPLDW